MITVSPHHTMTLLLPMWRDTGVIIYALIGQDALMGKHSWQLHQHRVTSSCLNSIEHVAWSAIVAIFFLVLCNSIGLVTGPPLLELSSFHEVVAVTHRCNLCDEIYGYPLLLDAIIWTQNSKCGYHINSLQGNTRFFLHKQGTLFLLDLWNVGFDLLKNTVITE